jgi:hypothetical protein
MKALSIISFPRVIALLLALGAADRAFASTASWQAENRRAEHQAAARRAELRHEEQRAQARRFKQRRYEERLAEERLEAERRQERRAARLHQQEQWSSEERLQSAELMRTRHRQCMVQKQTAIREGDILPTPYPLYCTHLDSDAMSGPRASKRVECC